MRRVAVLASLVAVTGVLAGCDKPIPKITLQSGSTSTQIDAQTYCFDVNNPKKCRIRTEGGVGSIHAPEGGTILIDVPRSVADHTWSAVSAQLQNGKFKTIPGEALTTGSRRDTHFGRVRVPYGAGKTYYLVVLEQRGGKQSASWVSRVLISD
jgi:hypothetical protein